VALAAYGLRLMARLGYLPERDAGGLVLTEGAKRAMMQLGRMPWDHMGRLRLSPAQRREMCRALRVFCENKLERRLKAWRSFEEGEGLE
jgi:hypothetical protein